MSVINRALTSIADKESASAKKLEKAEIKPVSNTNKFAWAVGGFALSLGLGGWAASQQQSSMPVENTQPISVQSNQQVLPQIVSESPTSKVAISRDINLYKALDSNPEHDSLKSVKITQVGKVAPVTKVTTPEMEVQSNSAVNKKSLTQSKSTRTRIQSDRNAVSTQVNTVKVTSAEGSITVEQVELAPKQLSDHAIERGKKALDSNDLTTAIQEFEIALKYVPSNEITRKQLAAFYFGKKDSRNAIEVLSQGIRLNEKSQALRIALSKLLIKEGHTEAALSPLFYLPESPDKGYLELRAALSQQIKNSAMANETYQLLVQRSPDNARWWLGLAIGQERNLQYVKAKFSYQQAIRRVGISKQSQAFIRDRLSLLEGLEGEQNAD